MLRLEVKSIKPTEGVIELEVHGNSGTTTVCTANEQELSNMVQALRVARLQLQAVHMAPAAVKDETATSLDRARSILVEGEKQPVVGS